MTCEKQIQAFVSIFNECYFWALSLRSVLLWLVNIPVLNHLYPRAKWKWKTKKEKLFTYWDCKAFSPWVQNLHQFRCQKYSARVPAPHSFPMEQRGWKLKLGGACSQSLPTGQAAFCSSGHSENIYLHFKGDKLFSMQYSYLKPSQVTHFPSQKHSAAILMYSCYHKANPKW